MHCPIISTIQSFKSDNKISIIIWVRYTEYHDGQAASKQKPNMYSFCLIAALERVWKKLTPRKVEKILLFKISEARWQVFQKRNTTGRLLDPSEHTLIFAAYIHTECLFLVRLYVLIRGPFLNTVWKYYHLQISSVP